MSRWSDITQLLSSTDDTVYDDAYLMLSVVYWVQGKRPPRGDVPHNKAWQLARQEGLIVRSGGSGSYGLTEKGRLLYESYIQHG